MTWPTIPPEHEGKRFGGSRFPGYDDPEFGDFRAAHCERLGATREGQCRVHLRFLSYYENKAGGCFECEPYLDMRSKPQTRANAASQPSRSDARVASEALF